MSKVPRPAPAPDYIAPRFYGQPIPRTEYEGDTWLDREELAYNAYSGAPTNSNRRARAVCFDGKLRTFKVGIPDTFFSIPAIGKINGRYVHGWVEISDNKVVFHRQSKYKGSSRWLIKHNNGTYYIGMSGIGPRFGGTVTEAQRFLSHAAAVGETGRHWGFVTTTIEEIADAATDGDTLSSTGGDKT